MVPRTPQLRRSFVGAGVELITRKHRKWWREAWLSKRFKQKSPVLGINGTYWLERQVYFASRGVKIVRVVLLALFLPLESPLSLISLTVSRASGPRSTNDLKHYNPFTDAPGVRSTRPSIVKMFVLSYCSLDRGHPPSAESGAPSSITRVDTPAP